MKLLLALLALLVAINPFGATFGQAATQPQASTQTQPSAPLFSLSVSLAENVVKGGSLVDLKIIKKNISTQDLGVFRIVGKSAIVYEIKITDADSNPAA